MYEEMALPVLAAAVQDVYEPGAVFDDPLQLAAGRGAIYRLFALLKTFTSTIQVSSAAGQRPRQLNVHACMHIWPEPPPPPAPRAHRSAEARSPIP